MKRFPVVSRNHLNCIPRAAIEERAVGPFAGALLAPNTEIWIDFNAAEWRMILIGDPEHAGFNRTVLDACRRARAAGATVSCNGQNARPLFACCLAVALRHGPVLVYDVVQIIVPDVVQIIVPRDPLYSFFMSTPCPLCLRWNGVSTTTR